MILYLEFYTELKYQSISRQQTFSDMLWHKGCAQTAWCRGQDRGDYLREMMVGQSPDHPWKEVSRAYGKLKSS